MLLPARQGPDPPTLVGSRSYSHDYSRILLPVTCCQSRLAERAGPPDPGVLGLGAEFPSGSISPPRRSAIEPPKEPPDSTVWERQRARPSPSRPGQQFRARRYWHEYRANHRNSPSAFGGRARRMAQAAHGLFRPMVVAWQKRPGCLRIAVTGEVYGPVDRSGQVIDQPGCLPSTAGFHTWRATRRKLPPMIAAISAAG